MLIVCVIIGLFFLTKGGDLLSDYCSSLAEELGIPSVVVGLTVVSIATSAPELFTSIAAISSGASGLVLGNIIGSNIANIALILGISLLIKPICTAGILNSVQLALLCISTFFFCGSIIFTGNTLDVTKGVILVIFIFCYIIGVTLHALKNRNLIREDDESNSSKKDSITYIIIMILLGGALLWVGSESLVYGSQNIAILIGIPNELIGFTLIAIGTSLPELAASVALIRKEQTQMLLGNILGSNLFNIGLVGGVAGILGPISSETNYPWVDHFSLVIFTLIFVVWMTGKKLTKGHGSFLIAAYIAATIITWIMNS